jgi:hypothetical protein
VLEVLPTKIKTIKIIKAIRPEVSMIPLQKFQLLIQNSREFH